MNAKRRRLLITALCAAAAVTAYAVYNIYIGMHTPSEYMIETNIRREYQSHNECAGYSAAYVLRSFGEDASGPELYGQITTRNKDGTVNPDQLMKMLKRNGHKSAFHLGNIRSLKYHISRGVPVIILCRSKPGSKYLHYIAVFGYDEHNIYALDSLENMVNSDDPCYNRAISLYELEKMWEIGYPVKNIYITVDG